MATVAQDDYHIAIFCALGIESDAVCGVFDELFDTESLPWRKAAGDPNIYSVGRIGLHNVVLVHLSGIGKVASATAAASLCASFGKIQLALVVGVCAGSPSTLDGKDDIYLGDVIISTQVVQADFGRDNTDGFESKLVQEGNLGPPPAQIRAFLHKLQLKGTVSKLHAKTKAAVLSSCKQMGMILPDCATDLLFPSGYDHKHRSSLKTTVQCNICKNENTPSCLVSQRSSCSQIGCEIGLAQRRRSKEISHGPSIHFGQFCSTDSVRKNGKTRDKLIKDHSVIAFEMEGAGVYEKLPSIVIKGVCDYADSHKNKVWQEYAATTSAQCCRFVLEEWPSSLTRIAVQPSSTEPAITKKSEEWIYEDLKRSYLKSLDFQQLDSRLFTIQLPHPTTCSWIAQAPEFKSWLDPSEVDQHHRILWIRGKPGSGKSTLLKHIYESRSLYFPELTCAAYFFYGQGHELQKSPVGMLRSLMYQLFLDKPHLLDLFMDLYRPRQGELIAKRIWTFTELRQFFFDCVRRKHLGGSLFIIDALDECSRDDDAREVATFCEDLTHQAIQQDVPLFICLSIRYFPNIGIKKSIRLDLDKKLEHTIDLSCYIQDKLRTSDQGIAEDLLQKAKHVFLWAVLVVRSLNTACDEGANDEELADILESTPEELHKIFEKLLGPPGAINKSTRLILQLVLYSFRPLTAQSLYLLVKACETPEKIKSWSQSGMSSERLDNYITTTSRGLLEVHRQGSTARKAYVNVQFIHESVRDYLTTDKHLTTQTVTLQHDARTESSDLDLGKTIRGSFAVDFCHEEIAQTCIYSIKAAPKQPTGPFHDLQDYPQIKYALYAVLCHISKVIEPCKRTELLRAYARDFVDPILYSEQPASSFMGDALLRSVIDLYAPFDQSRHRRLQPSELAKLLKNILDDTEIISMNKALQSKCRYEDALFAACRAKWKKGVAILLDGGAQIVLNKDDNVLHFTMRCLVHSEDIQRNAVYEAIAELLVDAAAARGQSLAPPCGADLVPLVVACRFASDELVTKLLKAGADPNVTDPEWGFSLSVAILLRRYEIARLLLHFGADPNGSECESWPPLAYAVQLGRTDLVQLL